MQGVKKRSKSSGFFYGEAKTIFARSRRNCKGSWFTPSVSMSYSYNCELSRQAGFEGILPIFSFQVKGFGIMGFRFYL